MNVNNRYPWICNFILRFRRILIRQSQIQINIVLCFFLYNIYFKTFTLIPWSRNHINTQYRRTHVFMLYDYHLTPTHIHTSKISVPRAKLQPHRFGGKPKNTPCVVLIALFRLGFWIYIRHTIYDIFGTGAKWCRHYTYICADDYYAKLTMYYMGWGEGDRYYNKRSNDHWSL